MKPPERRTILGVRVDATSYADATERVIDWAKRGESCYVCLGAVNNIMEARDSAEYRTVMEQAALVTSDGMPLVWLLRQFGIPHATRVYGPDLTPQVMEAAEAAGVPIGFYGGTEPVLQRLLQVVNHRFPALRVSYISAPPFRPLTPAGGRRYHQSHQRRRSPHSVCGIRESQAGSLDARPLSPHSRRHAGSGRGVRFSCRRQVAGAALDAI